MSREEYQRKRAENYKRFSGAIVQYQAIAGLCKRKKYLQYFLVDTAIVPVLRKIFEHGKGKKLQECTAEELAGNVISDFIDSIPDATILEYYQLHHGPVGSDEHIAARALFTRKAQCTFETSLMDTAKELVKTIGRPMNKLLSWSEEFNRPQWKDHGLFEEDKTQAVFKEDALTREDFLPVEEVDIPQPATSALDASLDSRALRTLDESHVRALPVGQPVTKECKEESCHYELIEAIESRELSEKRVEKLEHAAKLRNIALETINVSVEPPQIENRTDQSESISELIRNGFEIGIYAPPQSGKNVYLKGRRHQLLSTDEFKFQPYKEVQRVAKRGIITSDVELAAKARVSLAIVPTWDVFRYRHFKTRIKTSERDYRSMLSKLGRYDYVLFTNQYVSQAMAQFD